jgi:tripartite-type tricarboxylate transporter receptor subunit TctC
MQMTRTGVSVAAVLACATAFPSGDALAAQNYPEKSIRMIVPYAPGGGSDISARIICIGLNELLGTAIVVDNRPGASGMIGTELAARSPPDGYTLLLADVPHTINPFIYRKVNYHPLNDFAPVSLIATTPGLLAVHPSFGVRSVKEFIAAANAKPGQISFAHAGAGTVGHLTGVLFMLRTGTQFNQIPYKGGGPAIADVVAGQVQVVFASAPGAVPFVKSGRLRGLAVSTAKRSSLVPDLPTFEEEGVADLRIANWYGVLAPAGTPKAIVERLNQAIGAAAAMPVLRERLLGALLEPVANTTAEFRVMLEGEAARWSKLVKDANVRAD